MKVKTVSAEMFIRSFHFRILNNITFTNSRLAKIGLFKMTLAHFVELAQKLSMIYLMNVLILNTIGKISKTFGLHFVKNM